MPISNKRKIELCVFCEKYNLIFDDLSLLNTAFTHSSFGEDNYERLEFLGDCVLRIAISEYLFKKYKKSPEGDLTKLRAQVVSDETLAKFAKKANFEDFIVLGMSETKNGYSEKSSILACAFEAVLGAIFLQYEKKNAIKKVQEFLFLNFKEDIEKIEMEIDFLNPKAMLQEYCQGKFHKLPDYKLLENRESEKNKIFKIEVLINAESYGKGKGNSKKEAQKQAAKNALLKLGLIKKEEK